MYFLHDLISYLFWLLTSLLAKMTQRKWFATEYTHTAGLQLNPWLVISNLVILFNSHQSHHNQIKLELNRKKKKRRREKDTARRKNQGGTTYEVQATSLTHSFNANTQWKKQMIEGRTKLFTQFISSQTLVGASLSYWTDLRLDGLYLGTTNS